MRHSSLLIILAGVAITSLANAASVSVEPLYWRATETIDWAFTNNQDTNNQVIEYLTVDFHHEFGIRASATTDLSDTWNTTFIYTHFHTNTKDDATGALTPAFLAAKIAVGHSTYSSGQVDFAINYDVFNLDLQHTVNVSPAFTFHPIIGLTAGSIRQSIDTSFQGDDSVVENMENNFTGIGPKVGIAGMLTYLKHENWFMDLDANFSSAYVFGHWVIKDVLHYLPPSTESAIDIDINSHNLGSPVIQASLGTSFHYKDASVGLYYDINDWFNQGQIFDDATGGHTNDLILQGLRLRMSLIF